MTDPAPRLAVIVTGRSHAFLRRFLAQFVKLPFGLHRCQRILRYREHYSLAVVSRPLRAGEDPQKLYGPLESCAVLVLGALREHAQGSGLAAARAWLAAKGFAPVAELDVEPDLALNECIDAGAEVVNFVNLNCPWRLEHVDDIDAYLEKHNKPFWA